jgi:hypothetical protein
MIYVASFSFGAASAIATQRAIDRYGRSKVFIWGADTGWEDEDAYRFAEDCQRRWGVKIRYHRTYNADGSIKTPLDVAEEKQIIPNSSLAPCSQELKFQPFEDWVSRLHTNVAVLLGFDVFEKHRISPRQCWHRVRSGKWRAPYGYHTRLANVVAEDYPLLWKPYEFRPYPMVIQNDWGIKPPRLYAAGFPHNNCGGRCFRQGQKEWHRLYVHFPERFAQMRDWETAQRAKGGARGNRAINKQRSGGSARPVTLARLEAMFQASRATLFDECEKISACICM